MGKETVKENNSITPRISFSRLPMAHVQRAMKDLLGWHDALSVELREINIESGSFHAFLPVGFSLQGSDDIRWSQAILENCKDRSVQAVVDFICAHLVGTWGGVALFASICHDGDPCIRQLETPYFFVSDLQTNGLAVWHLLSRENADEAAVRLALSETRPFTGLICLTSLPAGTSRIEPKAAVTEEQVRALAARTAWLIGEVFDGDTYMIWGPSPGAARDA